MILKFVVICFREQHASSKTYSPEANVSYSDLIDDINSLTSDDSVLSFQCYATGCDVIPITSMDELVELLKEFPKREGTPIRVGFYWVHILREDNKFKRTRFVPSKTLSQSNGSSRV